MRVHESLYDCGDKACVDGSADDTIAYHQLAAPFEGYLLSVAHVHLKLLVAELVGVGRWHSFGVWLDNQVNLAELSGATRLFLVTVVGTCGLRDSLAIRYARLFEYDGELVVVFDAPFECAQVEFTPGPRVWSA